MSAAAFEACAGLVRRADPDRYFSALFAPAKSRPCLFALYALNHELARIGETVSEPMLGQIRLQWWREALEGARQGQPRRHDVVEAMADVFRAHDIPADLLEGMLVAREFDVSRERFRSFEDLVGYLDWTSGNVMRLAARLLGATNNDPLTRALGVAYGLVGMIRAVPFHARRGKIFVPDDLLEEAGVSSETFLAKPAREQITLVLPGMSEQALRLHAASRTLGPPGPALPAILPASLVRLYLRQTRRRPGSDVALFRRQLVLLWAAFRGGV